MDRNGTLSHKIDYITIYYEIINHEGHQNGWMGEWLNGWIFPSGHSGEASRWRVCYQQGLPLFFSFFFYSIEVWCSILICTCQNCLKVTASTFHRIGPTGPIQSYSHHVRPSVCSSVVLRHQVQFFLGLSLALRSHDQFRATHWSPPRPLSI